MKINRKELLAALEAVRPGIANKEIIEQSTLFVFQGGRVYAYNDMIAISHAAPKELKGAVQSIELHKLLARMSDEEIDIETTDKEFLVKGVRNKAGIALQADITLPVLDVNDKKTWLTLPEGFAAAVKFCLFSASADMTKPALTCVHIDGKFVQTCDNFRLTQYELPGKGIKAAILIPASACSELVKYKPTHYAADENWIHFTNASGTEFSCRTVDEKFPDLTSFVERKSKYKIQFHEDTATILDRAIVFLSDDRGALQYVKVIVDDGRMTIRAEGSAGWFEEKVRVKYKGETIEFMINPIFLKDMLGLLRDVSMDEGKAVLKFEGENFVHCCAVVEGATK